MPTSTPPGLCATCSTASTCIFLRSAEEPILQCEEFDDRGPAAPKPARYDADIELTRQRWESAALEIATLQTNRGLCANCEHNATCTFDRPEAGVWHCEEYA